MNSNIKLIVLIVLIASSVGSFFYLDKLKKEVSTERSNYHSASKELNIIKQLDTQYGTKTKNKRTVNRIIGSFGTKVVHRKEDKKSIEFKITKLNFSSIDRLNKELLNSGLKIVYFKIKRLDPHSAELTCKVVL